MPTPPPRATLLAGAALASAGALAILGFGPLDPPNGPITPTYKTLSEVEPRIAINADNTPGDADSVYRITLPGSYYLTGSFNVPSGKSGIEIAGANITVDLNGFRLLGLSGSLDGIHVNTALYGVTIRNGAVSSAPGDGIDALDSSVRIEGVSARGSGGQGIVVGDGSEVARCTVVNNGSHGINTGDDSRVADCTARDNGGVGIDVDNDSIVRDCIATGNTSDGISANDGCTIAGCTASSNTANGINTTDTCIVTNCIGRANGGVGIDVDHISLIRDCAARDNTGDGIGANNGSVVSGSTASANQSGITAGIKATVSGCNTYLNRAHGIEFGSYSDIRGNNASGQINGAGLYTSGQYSRVDENQIQNNAVGITLDGQKCLVHRNDMVFNVQIFTGADDDYIDGTWTDFSPWWNLW